MTCIILALSLAVITPANLAAQGIEFFEGDWDEALKEAEATGKLIFVDAYATWCGPCKRMSAGVFPRKEVGEFYNRHFISLKIDAEKGEGLKWRKKYPVNAFPTLYYIDGNGEVVLRARGYRDAERFIAVGQQALNRVDNTEEYAKRYEDDERDPAFVLKYLQALNRVGKPSLKVANDYLRSVDNLSSPENLAIIYEAAIEADSKIFEWLVEYRDEIVAAGIADQEDLNAKIEDACSATADKAREYQMKMLLDEAIAKMEQYRPDIATAFAYRQRLVYYRELEDIDAYLGLAKEYGKKEIKKDPEELNRLAQEILEHYEDRTDAVELAEWLAGRACKHTDNFAYHLTHALALYNLDKQKRAMEALDKAAELAEEVGPGAVRKVEKFRSYITG